jgi:hypothetical protein
MHRFATVVLVEVLELTLVSKLNLSTLRSFYVFIH